MIRECFIFQQSFPKWKQPTQLFHCFTRPYFTISSFFHALFKFYGMEPGVYSSKQGCEYLA